MENYYKNAVKRGQKYNRQRLAKGAYPNLPVLDEILPENKQMTGRDLGLVQIPSEWIVGTVSSARAVSFAGNFMPAADEKSEFAMKWKRLCASHLEEGIREPVRVCEYMNRFYVLEGNKRVSVLKYFEAPVVSGYVRRILPDRDGDEAAERYYELIDFQARSGINFIEFSRRGSCRQLQNAVGKLEDAIWTDEEVRKFSAAYYTFRKVYLACGGDRLTSTTGDAFLAFIRIYGYDILWRSGESQIRKILTKAWGEIAIQQEESMIEIRTEPEADGKGLLQRVIGTPRKKVAFLYDEEPVSSSWSYYHELGRRHAQNVFSEKISTKAYILERDEAIDGMMEQMIRDGADVIFTAFPRLLPGIVKAALEHPEIDVLNCSLNESHRSIRTYYPRMYEAKFVSGAIAGSLCRSHKLGYICKYPVYGAIAEINAFARGAQLTDPDAEVYLEWSSVGGMDAAENRLLEKGAELVSFREFAASEGKKRYLHGLKWMQDDRSSPLVLPVWNWGVYYERILRAVLNGTFRTEEGRNPRSLNYYWGMSAGVVDMIYADRLPDSARYLGDVLCRAIRDGSCQPFYRIERAAGRIVIPEEGGQQISMEDIIRMDYLEDNVQGEIPAYEELEEKAKILVNHQGVELPKKEADR
ncbi:MAG: BMP family ABC transporter substrate-binding protein [Eubacterium sp.]|nr:BMP family ABC transporter substrate-binding protein [Eubacterium sp.]